MWQAQRQQGHGGGGMPSGNSSRGGQGMPMPGRGGMSSQGGMTSRTGNSGYGPPPQAPMGRSSMGAGGQGQGVFGGGGGYQGGYMAPPMQSSSSPSTSSNNTALTCTGCKNMTVANIIKGTFLHDGDNHGKPVYRKDSTGSTTVLIYYWDDRDGPSFSGWWFGPKLGGDQVWAYNSNTTSQVPPSTGWKVPWDGAVDDVLKLLPTSSQSSGRQDSRYSQSTGRREEEDDRRRREGDRHRDQRGDYRDQQRDQQRDLQREQQREQQRREDEQRRRRDEEERRRQKEKEREEDARRAAEMKRRRDEEETRRKEQNATLMVRKVIQRLRMATPESYDQLRADLVAAQEKHLEDMGSQAEKVSQEAEKALQQAQARVDDMNRQKEEEERRKQEEEKRRKEEIEMVAQLTKEAREETEAVEGQIKAVEDSAKEIPEGAEAEPEAITSAADACIKAVESAQAKLDTTDKAIDDKWEKTKRTHLSRESGKDLQDLQTKLAVGRRSLEKVIGSAKAAKERAARKSAALKKWAKRKDKFGQVDGDGDGKLNLEEAVAFAKSEYNFELPKETQDRIMRVLEPITLEKFNRLRSMVAIANSEVKARQRRAEEEERKRVLAEMKATIQKILDEGSEALSGAEKTAADAEEAVRPLNRSDDLSKENIQETVVAAQGLVKEAEESLKVADEKLQSAEEKSDSSESLKDFASRDLQRLKGSRSRVQGRVERLHEAIKAAQDKAVQKALAELEQHRKEAIAAARAFMTSEKKKGEELYAHVVGEGGKLTKEKWTTFLTGLPDLKLSEEQIAKLFDHVVGNETTEEMSEEQFVDLLRFYLKCVKGTVLTEDVPIKSKTVKRLEVGDILEALEGPTKDENSSVMRYRCMCVGDRAVGWATIAGNQGTPFLEPGGQVMTCIRDTVVTDSFSVQDQASQTLRRVTKGELVDVIEFPKKDDAVGLSRIKGKLKLDGVTGWITVSGSQGSVFFEPC